MAVGAGLGFQFALLATTMLVPEESRGIPCPLQCALPGSCKAALAFEA